MSIAEMRHGASNASWGAKQRERLAAYLADFDVLHSSDELCSRWAEVRTLCRQIGRPIGSADSWVAAAALTLGAPLVTNNAKHYRQVPGLQLISAPPAPVSAGSD